jgi:hypothetical protein
VSTSQLLQLLLLQLLLLDLLLLDLLLVALGAACVLAFGLAFDLAFAPFACLFSRLLRFFSSRIR